MKNKMFHIMFFTIIMGIFLWTGVNQQAFAVDQSGEVNGSVTVNGTVSKAIQPSYFLYAEDFSVPLSHVKNMDILALSKAYVIDENGVNDKAVCSIVDSNVEEKIGTYYVTIGVKENLDYSSDVTLPTTKKRVIVTKDSQVGENVPNINEAKNENEHGIGQLPKTGESCGIELYVWGTSIISFVLYMFLWRIFYRRNKT